MITVMMTLVYNNSSNIVIMINDNLLYIYICTYKYYIFISIYIYKHIYISIYILYLYKCVCVYIYILFVCAKLSRWGISMDFPHHPMVFFFDSQLLNPYSQTTLPGCHPRCRTRIAHGAWANLQETLKTLQGVNTQAFRENFPSTH